jgi:hypothetical protein
MRVGLSTGTRSPANSSGAASFPERRRLTRGDFWDFSWAPEPIEMTGVCYLGTGGGDKMQASIRFPLKRRPGDFQ